MAVSYSPLRYPGGKSQFYRQVLKIITSNKIYQATYIEPFAGGAGVAIRLLVEGVVDKIIINDIDVAIYAFWKTVVDDNEWLVEKVESVEVSIEEWRKQKKIYMNSEKESLRELGFATLFLNRCNRSGILSAGPIGGMNQQSDYKINCRFNKKKIISLIKAIGLLKNRIIVCNYDASELIDRLKEESNAFWFIDPPYYEKGAELYKNSFSKSDHTNLSEVIKNKLKGHKWILTYDVKEEIYNLYKSFKYELITLKYSVEKKKEEKEYLFYNNLIIRKEALL